MAPRRGCAVRWSGRFTQSATQNSWSGQGTVQRGNCSEKCSAMMTARKTSKAEQAQCARNLTKARCPLAELVWPGGQSPAESDGTGLRSTTMGGTASCGGYVWTWSRWSVCPCFTSHSHQGFSSLQDLVPLLYSAPERLREVHPKVRLSHTWGSARQVTQYASRTEFAVASRPAYRATRLTPGMTSASSTRTEVSRVSPETILESER